jgi:hypothetical protein
MGSGIQDELVALAKSKTTVIAFVDGDRGGRLLLMELSGKLGKSLTHVALAPTSREVEHLEGKVITKCLSQKETANKIVSRIQAELAKEDDVAVGRGQEVLEAPEEVKIWSELLEGLKRNQAVIVNADGSGSEPIGASSLETKLAESEGAIGLVFSGKITDRIFTLASGAGIENVMGTSVGTVTRKSGVQAYSSSNL